MPSITPFRPISRKILIYVLQLPSDRPHSISLKNEVVVPILVADIVRTTSTRLVEDAALFSRRRRDIAAEGFSHHPDHGCLRVREKKVFPE
jgi:hypothetical protein